VLSVDGSTLSASAWQNLDSELVRRSKHFGKPPLREKASSTDDWESLVRPVEGENDLKNFIDTTYRLFIEDREERDAIIDYPWLFLVYHRTRLVRNYLVHGSNTRVALSAWNAVCTRAIGGERQAYRPTSRDEWRAIQTAVLRGMYAGIHNAIEIAGRPR
jgi:hypothetical protein